jgi:hypothetical protein
MMDESGTSIVQRGLFGVPVGERKLCLLIEGQSKFAVQVEK